MKNIGDDFDLDGKYKLYRSLYEILHPTISKKNISNYKIVLDDFLVPIRVFYPKKVSEINSFIIYIHGNGDITGCSHSYSSICEDIAKETNHLILAIDYDLNGDFKSLFDSCYNLVCFLYSNVSEFGIDYKNIAIMGDSFGAGLAISIARKAKKSGDFNVEKEIILYPILSDSYSEYMGHDNILVDKVANFYENLKVTEDFMNSYLFPLKEGDYKNMPHSLVITANMDYFKKDGVSYFELLNDKKSKYLNMDFLDHGFLYNMDDESMNNLYQEIRNFLN